jgi:hypothetical protein
MSTTTKLTEAQRAEIVELGKDPACRHEDVARMYNVSRSLISYVCRREGIHRHSQWRTKKTPAPRPAGPSSVQSLDAQIEATRKALQDLCDKRAELEIRFEIVDETTLLVHGVTKQFIALEGVAKFRAFVAEFVNRATR